MTRLTDAQRERVLALHRQLVSIRSCNTSREQADRDHAEAAMADCVSDFLTRMGMEVERHLFAPGRPNLTAHWPDQQSDTRVAFQSHLDTVGIDGMTRPPFDAAVENGRIHGRGACDTKGSMAAFLAALAFARESGWKPADKWFFVATACEEIGCAGAKSLVAQGFRVDAMVVGEPTRSQLVTAHKGQTWLRVTARGRSCHASEPEHGRNAVAALARAAVWCEDVFTRHMAAREHPLLGGGTASVGTFTGGVIANIVPARAEMMIDTRMLPDETPQQIADRFLAGVREDLPELADVLTVELDQANCGLETDADRPFARNLIGVCKQLAGQTGPVGVNYFADSGPFHAGGIETVLFGPGDIAQAHTPDEFLEVEQLDLATEIALNWLLNHQEMSILK